MSTEYVPETTPELVKKFIVDFFLASDTKPPAPTEGEDPYVTSFTENGVLTMGSTNPPVEGRVAIAGVRQGMWSKVLTRHHIVNKVTQTSSNEYKLEGTVGYGLINGKSLVVDWTSEMTFSKQDLDGGKVQLENYIVYIDMSPVAAALAA